MNDVSKKIKELRDEIQELEWAILDLERANSGYFIGVEVIGDNNYWDEYYYGLGFITEEAAKAWVSERNESVYDARYFEVTEEIHRKFYDWKCLDNLYRSIDTYNSAISNLEGVHDFKEVVGKAIADLAKEIRIEHLSFMHPGNEM